MNFSEAMVAAQEGGMKVRPTSWAGVGYIEWDGINFRLIDDQAANVTQDYSDEVTWETVETLVTAAAAFQAIYDGGTAKRAGSDPNLTLTKATDPVLGDIIQTIGGGRPTFTPEDLIATDWYIVTPAP